MPSTGPFGSSNVSRIGTAYSVKGNTGILGFTGPTGITGDALVGPMGPSVLGISVDNNFLVTKFTNGATLSTPTQIYGATETKEEPVVTLPNCVCRTDTPSI